MGKKKKGGKKKGGKKKKEEQMTWKEALLAYQINIKEKQMEDVRYELRALEEKNERHKERNERLKEEQIHYINLLLKQARELESKMAGQKDVDKVAVIEVMKDKWQAEREEEKSEAELKEQIARKESEIVREKRQVQYWNDYKEKGYDEHKKQMILLQKELVDMQSSFDEMAGHLTKNLHHSKEEIGKVTEEKLDKQKYQATERAIAKMDKYSRQEVQDNDWLKREVEVHKGESDELAKEVEKSELENLKIMSELFECTVDDLKISRNFYLTQFGENENIDETGILEVDLSKISVHDRVKDKPIRERPKSAKLQAIEERVFSLPAAKDETEDDDVHFDGKNCEDEDPFNSFYHFDEEDFDDYLQLGPLELKMLNIKGQQMSIYKPKTPPLEELLAKQYKPDEWPVTPSMLKEQFKNDKDTQRAFPITTPRKQ